MKKILMSLMTITFALAFVIPYAESQEPPKPPIVIAVDGLALREIGPMGIEPKQKIGTGAFYPVMPTRGR